MSFADLVESADRAAQDFLGGQSVTYETEFGARRSVVGIFDEQYVKVDPGSSGGLAVEQAGPAIFFRLEDLPLHPEQDDPRITIGDKVYRVRERQTDGAGGGIRLLLHVEE